MLQHCTGGVPVYKNKRMYDSAPKILQEYSMRREDLRFYKSKQALLVISYVPTAVMDLPM